MINKELYRIFREGSKTYFYSSVFFPEEVKRDVFSLYAFVRTADNFVDAVPQQKKHFFEFKEEFYRARKSGKSRDIVIDSFIKLEKRRSFKEHWATAFLQAMESDLKKNDYESLKEVEKYMFGSAEVVGLFMSRILGLEHKADKHAMLLGKAMQYINFIRDIDEDWKMGRTYFPKNDFQRFGLNELSAEEARINPIGFSDFIREQISYYNVWQAEAEKGFRFIPRRYLIPIKTASEMYKWTAGVIKKQPTIVFEKKIRPSRGRIIANALCTTIFG
jgi:15-cis-phytoene synthase